MGGHVVHRGLGRGSGRAVAEGLAPLPGGGGAECGGWSGSGGEKGVPEKRYWDGGCDRFSGCLGRQVVMLSSSKSVGGRPRRSVRRFGCSADAVWSQALLCLPCRVPSSTEPGSDSSTSLLRSLGFPWPDSRGQRSRRITLVGLNKLPRASSWKSNGPPSQAKAW